MLNFDLIILFTYVLKNVAKQCFEGMACFKGTDYYNERVMYIVYKISS